MHAVARPLGELDLGDARRLDEDRLARRLRAVAVGERRVVARSSTFGEAVELGLGEARADAARRSAARRPRATPTSSAPMRSRALALARQPAADDDVLAAHVLDLQPARRAAAGLVRAVELLRDDALEAVRRGSPRAPPRRRRRRGRASASAGPSSSSACSSARRSS